ncbi:MAG: glycosyltransferase family 1 protein [Proteobacteria bacterium]|nr:glycosyltransferase family 1 protein [Pseudomonadota bacterium]
MLALLQNPPPGFRVEPVYLSSAEGIWHYRYARGYAKKLLALKGVALEETAVEIGTNDIFYSPDFYPGAVLEAAQSELYQHWRRLGIEVNFMVFDLLPVLRPEFFPEQADQLHARWLDCVADNADRLICISNSVAAELAQWLKQRGHDTPVKIVGIPLGADINASKPSTGVPADANLVLSRIGTAPSFLMVGTIEPRKGHLQTLAAFEQLWQAGSQLKLVIVGKEGWTPLATEQRRSIPEIVDRLRHHPELGKRLFWLQDVSDEYLERVYKACTCLIFASEGEGFGLPLIEAAQHKLPIIARDMPVCREVAQQHAHYFTGLAAENLATAISDWLKLHKSGRAPSSTAMSWLTWTKNVEKLVAELTDDNKLT